MDRILSEMGPMGRMGVMGRMMDREPRGLIYEKSMTQDTNERPGG